MVLSGASLGYATGPNPAAHCWGTASWGATPEPVQNGESSVGNTAAKTPAQTCR